MCIPDTCMYAHTHSTYIYTHWIMLIIDKSEGWIHICLIFIVDAHTHTHTHPRKRCLEGQTPSSSKGWCQVGWGWGRTWPCFPHPEALSTPRLNNKVCFPLKYLCEVNSTCVIYSDNNNNIPCPSVLAGRVSGSRRSCRWTLFRCPQPWSLAIWLTGWLPVTLSTHSDLPDSMAGEDNSNLSPSAKASWGHVLLPAM